MTIDITCKSHEDRSNQSLEPEACTFVHFTQPSIPKCTLTPQSYEFGQVES